MTSAPMTDDERYSAMKSRDRRFDGQFIVGVTTTGIYCRPSCPTPVQPLRKNVAFHESAASAQRAGLRACKRCRPDASPGSPHWAARNDTVGRAMRLITGGWLDHHSVVELAAELATSERHLHRLLVSEVGAPPIAIARAQRAQTARTLIETTSMAFSDIAFASGFASLRQFNDTVRSTFAMTPTQLRRDKAVTTQGGELSLRLAVRQPIAADYFRSWFARRAVASVARVDDDTIETSLRLKSGSGLARLRFVDDYVHCLLKLDQVRDLAEAVRQCRTALDLDCDPIEVGDSLSSNAAIAPLVKKRPGLRSPGSVDGFATLIFAVLGQQRSVAAAQTLAGRIVSRVRNHDTSAQVPLAPFPSAEQIAQADLAGLGLTGRNIDTLHAVGKQWTDRESELGPAAHRDQVRAELVSIKGIGPWTADYVQMRSLSHPDIWLGGDLVAARAGGALGLDDCAIAATRPWRSYLTHHLWAASTDLASQSTPPRSAGTI